MDTTALAIAGVGTALFVGVIVWKGLWFLRKINEEPVPDESDDEADRGAIDD